MAFVDVLDRVVLFRTWSIVCMYHSTENWWTFIEFLVRRASSFEFAWFDSETVVSILLASNGNIDDTLA